MPKKLVIECPYHKLAQLVIDEHRKLMGGNVIKRIEPPGKESYLLKRLREKQKRENAKARKQKRRYKKLYEELDKEYFEYKPTYVIDPATGLRVRSLVVNKATGERDFLRPILDKYEWQRQDKVPATAKRVSQRIRNLRL